MKKSTWIMVGIFAVLLAGFLLYPKIAPSQEEEPAEPTATPRSLQSLDDQALASITYIGVDGETVKLEKVESLTWAVTTHPKGRVTAGNVEEILSNLSNLQITANITEISDLSEIGLEDPHQSISFIFEDGAEYTLTFGDLTVLEDGYYAQINGEEIVVLPNGSVDQLASLFEMITQPPTPTPTAAPSATPTPSPTAESND